LSLFALAKGEFTGFTYDSSDSYLKNGTFYVDFQPGYHQDLRLLFANSLNVPNLDNPIIGGAFGPPINAKIHSTVPSEREGRFGISIAGSLPRNQNRRPGP